MMRRISFSLVSNYYSVYKRIKLKNIEKKWKDILALALQKHDNDGDDDNDHNNNKDNNHHYLFIYLFI